MITVFCIIQNFAKLFFYDKSVQTV